VLPVLDINTASFEDLRVLRGVGVVTALRIIQGRPYEDTYALVSRGLLSEGSYDRNAQYLAVRRAATTVERFSGVDGELEAKAAGSLASIDLAPLPNRTERAQQSETPVLRARRANAAKRGTRPPARRASAAKRVSRRANAETEALPAADLTGIGQC